jgi:ABC-type uncharacterized transport system permease subunit
MEPIEPDRDIALKVWWAFTWRSFLISLVIAMAIGLLLGILGIIFGMSPERQDSLSGTMAPLLGLIVYVFVSIEVMRRILKKKFKTFEIAVTHRQE